MSKIMKHKPMNEYPLMDESEGVPLFYPYVPNTAIDEVINTMSGRWIGQGPKVELFEKLFKKKFLGNHEALCVGSGTDALHLAYKLCEINKNDEVIVPVFTCTATNIPLLYIGAKIIFADIDKNTMNLSIDDVKNKVTKNTKAIVCVDYGGIPNNYHELNEICNQHNIKLISDAAQAIGAKYKNIYAAQYADYTIFSFQAIKTLTTGDGGLLAIKDTKLLEKAKRLRWFGIDRSAKQKGVWENDIFEIGYKYQMNDIAASIGIASLKEIDKTINYRNELFNLYKNKINNKKVKVIGEPNNSDYRNSPWLMTIIIDEDRNGLMAALRKHGIESAQVHYRNDRYTIFKDYKGYFPNMDSMEDKYLVLPLHMKLKQEDVIRICDIINNEW
jgi:perosamine synthetase